MDYLSEQLGLNISNPVSEAQSENFKVDIQAESDNGPVVIENQFGPSNHDHLGKIITYRTAFNAKIAIWIVEEARKEHIDACHDRSRHDLAALADDAAAAARTLPPLYIACGTEDFLFQANVDFRDHLVELGADVTWDEVAGFGHEWRFWDMQVEKFLDWIPRDDMYAKMGKRPV